MSATRCQLFSGGRIAPNPLWRTAPHSHPFHELIAVTAGRMTVRMAGRVYSAEPGQCLWYPPGVDHEEQSDAALPVETHYIAFEWDGWNPRWPLCFSDTQGRLATLLRWILMERDTGTAIRQAFLEATVAEFVRVQTAPLTPTLQERVRSHIRAHLAEPLTLTDLAKCVEMSKFHFARRYRALTGRTPMEEIRQLRLEAARDLLLTTDLPLKAIAPHTGLGDEYHLSRLFHRAFGIAPGGLRRHAHAGVSPNARGVRRSRKHAPAVH
jgi:AraC-like DNA-binding protein